METDILMSYCLGLANQLDQEGKRDGEFCVNLSTLAANGLT